MSNMRVNAWSMLFEPGTLNGIPMIGTGALLEHETIPDGYYCYDVKALGEGQDIKDSIILRDLSDYADGSIILTEPLDFQGKTELSLENLTLDEDDPMLSFEDFLEQNQEQSVGKEMGSYLSQSM